MRVFWRLSSIFAVISLILSSLPVLAVENTAPVPAPLLIAAANFDNDVAKNPLGEFVELKNTTDEDLSLKNVVLKYNKTIDLATFPANSFVKANGYIVLKNSEHFSRNLSMTNGTLTLELDKVEIDQVEWSSDMKMDGTGKNRSATLVKCHEEICETAYLFEKNYVLHEDGYFEVEIKDENGDGDEDEIENEDEIEDEVGNEDEGDDELVLENEENNLPEVLECDGLLLNEIYTYFENDASEQFLEFYNSTEDIIELKTCQIWIKYSGKYQKFALEAGVVAPDDYLVFYPSAHDLKLAKNPSGTEIILLLDDNSEYILDMSVSLAGQKKAWSFALIDGDWTKTMQRTPGLPNVAQVCPTGKIINPSTGKCIGIIEDEPLPDCGAGKFRNPETNRCKSYDVLSTALTPCNEGYYRNELTNRCNKIAVAKELEPCEEGYERNPETNRCRKIRENSGTEYGVEPLSYNDRASFVAWGAAGGMTAMGTGYTVFQFRSELWRFIKKLLRIKK
ncbi:MAG: lamin tail domain-containing protein [Candidatus Nomurabacteria bacterium]|jgi:hypothetical protein|nr:lamin tail domain-containing protein [Candidatus Nomurabacteria bacterium]